MGESLREAPPSEKPPRLRLDSWKEIAAYLNRDVTTVQRWEKREGMPVRRHLHDKRGSVYALSGELDAWRNSRRLLLDGEEKNPEPEAAAIQSARQAITKRRVRLRLTLAAVACACLLALAYPALRNRPRSAAPPKIRSLAVLPLKNLTGDPTQEYLADGMTDALIGRLAGIHDLRVMSYTSVMRFKTPNMSVPEIARTLGADAIVEGSVMREGNRLRVTAQLIRGATDEHFWSESYDREMQDVLTLQSELAETIAEKVEATVSGEEQGRLRAARSVAPEVYESYLKGRFALEQNDGKTGGEQSLGYFQDAIRKDPAFAPAYLGVAEAYDVLGTIFAGESPAETRPNVISAARKALELDPNLADAHVLLADVEQREWHWAEAEAEYRRALGLNPNDAGAHSGMAQWLLCQGRTDEALEWARRARELNPTSGGEIAWILFMAHRYDEAMRELKSALALQPEDRNTLEDLGFVLIAKNQPAEAIPVLEKAAFISHGSPSVLGVLIRAYAHAHRRRDALRVLAELQARAKKGYVPGGAFVLAYLGLGETEQAFAWLEQAYKERSNILQFVKVHPYFDPLRGDPRFADLVRRIGLGEVPAPVEVK